MFRREPAEAGQEKADVLQTGSTSSPNPK